MYCGASLNCTGLGDFGRTNSEIDVYVYYGFSDLNLLGGGITHLRVEPRHHVVVKLFAGLYRPSGASRHLPAWWGGEAGSGHGGVRTGRARRAAHHRGHR